MKRHLLVGVSVLLCLTVLLLTGCTNKEKELIAQTIAQIEQEPSWQKKVDIYESAEIDASTKQNEVKPVLRASIAKDCPGMEEYLKRPDRKEAWAIYDEYGPPMPITYFRGDLKELPIDEILTNMSELLVFYREIGMEYKAINEVNYYSFHDYDFNESVKMQPEIADYENAEAIEYDSQYKYVVLYRNRDRKLFLLPNPMLRFLPAEEIPRSVDEIDLAIVAADYAAGDVTHYEGGSVAVGLRTNICVYDYRTGELLGLIDSIYQGARGWVSGTSGGTPSFPKREVTRAIGTFFNFY